MASGVSRFPTIRYSMAMMCSVAILHRA